MKTFDAIKSVVLTFIIVDLTIMLLFAILAETSEIIYADTLNTAETFIGQSAEAVEAHYGSPDGWQFMNHDDTTEQNDSYWYFGKKIFHIRYDTPDNAAGTVVDVEVLR